MNADTNVIIYSLEVYCYLTILYTYNMCFTYLYSKIYSTIKQMQEKEICYFSSELEVLIVCVDLPQREMS